MSSAPPHSPEPAPSRSVVSARGVVKRYGRTVALAGLDAERYRRADID